MSADDQKAPSLEEVTAEFEKFKGQAHQVLSIIASGLGLKTTLVQPIFDRIVEMREENRELQKAVRTAPEQLNELAEKVEALEKKLEGSGWTN